MRLLVATILSLSLLAWSGAHAQIGDGSFNVGAWHGSPVSTDGGFAYCGMQAFFGRKDAPVGLTIGLDQLRGWTIAVRGDQFALTTGQIKAGLAFDDETPIDVRGEIESPTMISFRFPSTDLLDRHLRSRKLVLIFHDAALPFALSGFEDATKALRSCVAANTAAPAEQPVVETATAVPAPVVASPAASSTEREPPNPRLWSEVVGPMIIGFIGSVTTVLLIGGIVFQVARVRARSRYLRLWSAEYRSSATRPSSMSLPEMRAAA